MKTVLLLTASLAAPLVAAKAHLIGPLLLAAAEPSEPAPPLRFIMPPMSHTQPAPRPSAPMKTPGSNPALPIPPIPPAQPK